MYFAFQGEKKKKKKTVTEKYWDWELANETKPIWVTDLFPFSNMICRKLEFYPLN